MTALTLAAVILSGVTLGIAVLCFYATRHQRHTENVVFDPRCVQCEDERQRKESP